jgi:PKD repeat protein
MIMKKRTITLLSGLMLCQAAFAQTQLPNANFEDWDTASNGKDSLIGWSSSNAVTMAMVVPMKKDLDAYQGTYAGKLITAPFGFVSYTKVSILVNGEATFTWNGGSGYSVEYVSGGGTPISVKPTELKGYYKTTANEGLVQVLLTKYNTTLQKRDTVSFNSGSLPATAAYTEFTVSLPDQMPGITPDTITTFFYSSNPATVPSNGVFADLYVDSLTLTQPAAPAPIADFSASPLTGTTDSIIQFTDNSTESPLSWNWTITPNTVTYLSGSTTTSQNPAVQFTAAGDYSIKLVVSNASGSDSITKTDYIHIDSSVGIHEIQAKEFLPVYPNPAKDKLYLQPYCEGADLLITDILGRSVATYKKITTSSIDLSGFNTGIYFLQFIKDGRSRTFKLSVKK